MNINHYAFKVWYRDFRVWKKYWWSSIVGALGEPVLYFLAMGYGLGAMLPAIEGMSYLQFIAPALLLSSIMNASSFETTYSSYTRMEIQKTFQAIASTPVHVSEVIVGEIFWAATKSLIPGFVMISALAIMGYVPSWQALWALPLLFIVALFFSSLGMLMTSIARNYDFFTYYITLFLQPLFLFSGTFFPLANLPPAVQKVLWFFPLTVPVDMTRHLFVGQADQIIAEWPSYAYGLGVVVLLLVTCFSVAVRRMNKRLVN